MIVCIDYDLAGIYMIGVIDTSFTTCWGLEYLCDSIPTFTGPKKQKKKQKKGVISVRDPFYYGVKEGTALVRLSMVRFLGKEWVGVLVSYIPGVGRIVSGLVGCCFL